MTDQPTVALLGTGTMGAGMARNIAAAGLPLRVWNRTRAKAEPLAEAGAQVADSAGRRGARRRRRDHHALRRRRRVESALTEARDGAGRRRDPGCSSPPSASPAPTGSAALADELGLVYVDAPVLGTKKPADDGALVVLASGPEDARAAVAAGLRRDRLAARVWVGEAGQGTRLKLVANSWVLTVVEGIAESLTLAKALGVEPRALPRRGQGRRDGRAVRPAQGVKAMLAGDFTPPFGLDGAAKDAGLIVEAARAAGATWRSSRPCSSTSPAPSTAGHGDQDMAATFLAH